MFIGEIIAITTLSSVPGILFGWFVFYKMSQISMVSNMFYISTPLMLFVTLLIFVVNLFIGLSPVMTTMKKTPAQILSRYDID